MLLTQYREKYWTQNFIIGAFWDKDERVNFGVKGQGHSVTNDLVGGGIQSSMLCVEF